MNLEQLDKICQVLKVSPLPSYSTITREDVQSKGELKTKLTIQRHHLEMLANWIQIWSDFMTEITDNEDTKYIFSFGSVKIANNADAIELLNLIKEIPLEGLGNNLQSTISYGDLYQLFLHLTVPCSNQDADDTDVKLILTEALVSTITIQLMCLGDYFGIWTLVKPDYSDHRIPVAIQQIMTRPDTLKIKILPGFIETYLNVHSGF
jgi:hypothetical protein